MRYTSWIKKCYRDIKEEIKEEPMEPSNQKPPVIRRDHPLTPVVEKVAVPALWFLAGFIVAKLSGRKA